MRGNQLQIGVLTGAGLRITDLEGREHGTVPIASDRRRSVYVARTSRGLRIAAWVGDSAFDLLDDAGQVLCRVTTVNEEPAPARMSPDGTRLCVHTGAPNSVAVYDATSGKQTAICKGHSKGIQTYTFSPDSATLATGSADRTACLWDVATGTLLATCRGHRSTVHSTSFSPDGSRLVTASPDGTVRQWDARTGQEVEPPYDRYSAQLHAAVYSPDGQRIASAGDDRTIRVWRARDRQDVAVLHGHAGSVVGVAFAPDGLRLASLSSRRVYVTVGDGTVRVWDVDPQATLPVLRDHIGTINQVAYSPDGRWLASGSTDNTVRLWDAATGEPCAVLPHGFVVSSLAFGLDGSWLVAGCGADDRLRIWDVGTAQVRKEIPLPDMHFGSVTVSPDGTTVAVTGHRPHENLSILTICDIASGKSLFSSEGAALAYSPDGRWLAVRAADEKTLLLLDARTYETAARFNGHEKVIDKATFSPDSRCLASCSRDRTVRLWQLEGRGWRVKDEDYPPPSTLHPPPCRVLRGHTDEVYAIAFHPDGTRLASAARDGAVWLWDVARGEAVARLPRHRSFVWSLAFSPDGATLASGSGDSTVRLWDTAPLKTRYQVRREAAALRPEAERLVEQLWREKNDPAEVASALRADRLPSEALRQAALRAVLRRAQPPQTAPDKPHN